VPYGAARRRIQCERSSTVPAHHIVVPDIADGWPHVSVFSALTKRVYLGRTLDTQAVHRKTCGLIELRDDGGVGVARLATQSWSIAGLFEY